MNLEQGAKGNASAVAAFAVAISIFVVLVPEASGAPIGETADPQVWDQVKRFLSLRDAPVQIAVVGCLLLGINCGLIGSFVVVRRLALAGDAISHAILPGIAVGFLWSMSKDPLALFAGAVAAGLLGSFVAGMITRTTRIKQDAALGIVLAGFFAAGVVLIDRINALPTSGKSGLDTIFFGSTAGMSWGSVIIIGGVTLATLLVVVAFYRQLLASSFDPGFARSIGIPERLVHHAQMLMLAFSVVVAVQAVGVVLVSAMLIIPPSTAYLLTDRMHRVVVVSCLVGMVAAVLGAFCSFLDPRLPTGPFIVLAGGFFFAAAFFFAPRHGVVKRWLHQRRLREKTARENTLKAMYHVLEEAGPGGVWIPISELAERRRVDESVLLREVGKLVKGGFARSDGHSVAFSDPGWERACEIVRNHRLWELYLTHAADIAPDHVHDDAEKIEHVLGPEVVRELERRLGFAREDPHGRQIPGSREIGAGAPG